MSRACLPNRRGHEAIGFDHGGFSYIAGIGEFTEGAVAEVFLDVAKSGTTIDAWAKDAAILASLALQHGAPPETIRHALGRDAVGAPATAIGAAFDLLLRRSP